MGRKKDSCWDHVDKFNDKFRCKFCRHQFAGGASRIKAHLSEIKGKGIDACTGVPEYVEEAACSTFDDFNKRPCNRVNSSNLEQNFVNSNLPSDLSKVVCIVCKGIKRKGIDTCTSGVPEDVQEAASRVPEDVQEAAHSTFDDSSKRTCNRVNSGKSTLAIFSDGDDFNAYVRGIGNAQNRGLTSYFLQLLGKPRGDRFNYNHEVYWTEKTIVFEGISNTASLLLPVDMNELQIKECEEWRSLCDVLSFDDKNNSKSCNILDCDITSCHKLENVFCLSSSCSFCSSIQSLESLSLDCLESLSILCKETNVAAAAPWGPFSSLKYLYVYGCNSMKTLLTPGMTRHLQNLETLEVHYCDAMEDIFSSERNSDITNVDLDALHIDGSGKSDISHISDDNDAVNRMVQSFEDLISSGTRTGKNNQEEQVADAQHIHHTHANIIKLPKLKSVFLFKLPRLNRVYEGILAFDSLQEFRRSFCPNLKEVPQIQPPFQITSSDEDSSDEELSN